MPINSNANNIGELDKIRLSSGADNLRSTLHNLIDNNVEEAINLINDENLQFPSLFLIQSEIKKISLFNKLNQRNKCALQIINDMSIRKSSVPKRSAIFYKQENYTALKWILETGYKDDGLNDRYDEILDAAALLLTKVYRDKACLSPIEEMIFNRYRKGCFIYDLVWAYFEASDPECLISLANRLRSADMKDVELARKFLNFIPYIAANSEEDPNKQYQQSILWINQNRDYLYYTGETFLQTSNPIRYAVSLESKYLQRGLPIETRKMSRSQTGELNEQERTLLNSFNDLDYDSKSLLSSYSSILYRKNKKRWNNWIHCPIQKQKEIAVRMLGGKYHGKNHR